MFSGLTNQVSSLWSGATKTGEQPPTDPTAVSGESTQNQFDEQSAVATQQQPIEENVPLDAAAELIDGEKKLSPTKAGGLFSGVKSQMTGWLGNASASIPSMPTMPTMPAMPAMSLPSIPGLRKSNNAAGEAEGGIANDGLATSPDKGVQHIGDGGADDEDKSSATEGADSGPGSPQHGATPTDEQGGKMGNVTTKVTEGAKTFGSFLYSAVNKAGAKIKKTVDEHNILGEFHKEQEAFMKNQTSKSDTVPPWVGHKNEASVKEEILSLSADRRNFVRAPPAGVDFEFNYDSSYSTAIAIMSEDTALEKMRFELVPKIITEENFWRNYFYRVSLICQAGDLGTLGEGSLMGQASSDDAEVKNINTQNTTDQNTKSDDKLIGSSVDSSGKAECKLNDSEFVSENYQATEKDIEEVQAGMRTLGIDTLAKQATENDDQWEKDLEAELQDYEVVADGSEDNKDVNWEADVDNLLSETSDLK